MATKTSVFSPPGTLTRPLFLASLLLLVLNDHLLKGSGWLDGAWTGKLSDFAGLLVAPAVAAAGLTALGMKVSIMRWRALNVLVGLVFAAFQLSEGLASALVASLGQLNIHIAIWPDPSDLWALLVLPLGMHLLGPEREPVVENTAPEGRLLHGMIMVTSLLACMATAGESPPPRYPYPAGGRVEADVFLRNTGETPYTVEIRSLGVEADLDCETLGAEGPLEELREHLSEASLFTLESRDGLPLWDRHHGAADRDCYALQLSVEDRHYWVSWAHGRPATQEIPIRLAQGDAPEAEALTYQSEGAPLNGPAGVVIRLIE